MSKQITVRATAEGFLDVFRKVDDVFTIDGEEAFAPEWMEKVKSDDLKEANAQQVFEAQGKTSIAAPDNPSGDAAVDALVGGNKGAQPGVIKDVGTPVAKKAK